MSSDRVEYANIEGARELFTPDFNKFLASMHHRFAPRILELRQRRAEVLKRSLDQQVLPSFPQAEISRGNWKVPLVPEDLKKPGIEISGPASVTGMFINALNPGPDGTRAEGDLDDDEDSAGYRFVDTLTAARNRLEAVRRTLTYFDNEKKKLYKLEEGDLPFFMHRERGLSVDEPEVTVGGKPVPASILGTALTLFYAGKAQAERGQGIYFYLPKLELTAEAELWKDFFDASREHLKFLKDATVRAVILVESLPAVFQMEEMLYALGPYAAGLNAARWDLKASILEFVMTDKKSVWPDRFGVDIKTTAFMADIFRRLVAVCLKHHAVAVGGMATALPSKDEQVNKVAAQSISNDKEWEARQGFLRGWVAHIFHMKTAGEPFKALHASGWKPTPEMANPDNFPIGIGVPAGQVTVEGTRRNVRTILEYLEGWLNGRGAKGIDSLAGKPGVHPALMEDLATARISVAQTAQRIRHSARDAISDQKHDLGLVKSLFLEEAEQIISGLNAGRDSSSALSKTSSQAETNYRKSMKIALQWVSNYLDLDFRSLGSYTRSELDQIAERKDAF